MLQYVMYVTERVWYARCTRRQRLGRRGCRWAYSVGGNNRPRGVGQVTPVRRRRRKQAVPPTHCETEAERKARRAAALKRYADSPAGKFKIHKTNAKRRGIPFLLTFTQWWRIWQRSGKWDQRGNGKPDDYVMGRKGDTGPYAVGNVEIITHAANAAVRNRLYERPSFYGAAARAKAKRGAPGPDVPF